MCAIRYVERKTGVLSFSRSFSKGIDSGVHPLSNRAENIFEYFGGVFCVCDNKSFGGLSKQAEKACDKSRPMLRLYQIN